MAIGVKPEPPLTLEFVESTPRFAKKRLLFLKAYAIFRIEEAAFTGIDHLCKGKRSGGKALTTLELEQLKRYYEPKGYTPDG